MNILLASSELHPFSKSGGLADMVSALAKSLSQAGHRVSVVTPLYRGIQEKFPAIQNSGRDLFLPLGHRMVQAEVWTLKADNRRTIYFIHQPDFYDRAALYAEGGRDYSDNPERFIFLSKCVAHLARHLPGSPDVVHTHDWQVGLVPILIKHEKWRGGWGKAPACCFTVHNLAYQGVFPYTHYPLTNLPWDYFTWQGLEFYGGFNCLKAGLLYSDILTTVSPRYAREITTPEFGCGLDGVLRDRQNDVVGILNGVDYDEWRTRENPNLKFSFSAEDLEGKKLEKLELQKELGLDPAAEVPLFATVTRLVDQKGVDIQLGALEEMLPSPMQFALLGSGMPEYEKAYLDLARRFPGKAAVVIGFNQGLSHRIEAGADFFLMPSRFEPCGLNQMYSLRYGTIPIVRVTGGLDDSVVDIRADVERANGIKFEEYSARALAKAMRKALVVYEDQELLAHYRTNAMYADFSWERTRDEYLEVYRRGIQAAKVKKPL